VLRSDASLGSLKMRALSGHKVVSPPPEDDNCEYARFEILSHFVSGAYGSDKRLATMPSTSSSRAFSNNRPSHATPSIAKKPSPARPSLLSAALRDGWHRSQVLAIRVEHVESHVDWLPPAES
jgi:hypothetical protein